MSGSPWDELGLPPDSDRAAVRSRYAQRLREVQHDPEAFQRLREAYEYCLAAVGRENGHSVPDSSVPSSRRETSAHSADGEPEFHAASEDALVIDRIAVSLLQRCTPLAFDPADLRASVANTPEFERLGLREAVGLRIAERIVEGAAATPHAIRELAALFGWDDVLAQRHGILKHPVLQDRLHRHVVPRRRTGSHGRPDLPWIAIPSLIGLYAFDIRGDRPRHHVPTLPPWLLDIGPWLLVVAIAAFLLLEFRMMDYDPRSTSRPLTPALRRNRWIARGVLALVVVVTAAATSRL